MDCNITNPSQLQEVTLDPDATNFSYMGMRSPGAITAGRSVKEIDEQLTNLKKENFDLKLRIYFLEERIGANFDTDKEDAIKKNIELRVELENIRKDLEEKQDLLCQAAKAMEIEEEEKKKEIDLRDEQISKLKEELSSAKNSLQGEINLREQNKELALCAQAFDFKVEGDHNLQARVRDLQNELQKERERCSQFEHLITVAEYTRARCKDLEEEIELKDNRLDSLAKELDIATNKLSTCNLQIVVLEEEISQKCNKVHHAVDQIKQRESDMKQHKAEYKELRRKYEGLLQEKGKWERTAEKIHVEYQAIVTKFKELQHVNENLRTKVNLLETTGSGSSVQQVASKNETSANEQILTSPNTLFSANQEIVPFSLPKALPKIIFTNKSIELTASIPSPASPRTLQSNTPQSEEAGEIVIYGNSSESNSVIEFSSEMCLSQEKHLGLQKDHFKACKMIKSLIQKKKECDQNIHDLRLLLADKDNSIDYLQKRISELTMFDPAVQRKKPIQEKVTEMKLTACFDPAATKENSMDPEEQELAETYKELVAELEIKIEVLNATLNEKDLHLEQLKIDLQEKANRIIDLEFELLATNEGVSYSLNSSNEKEDTGTEKVNIDCDKDQQIEKLENELRQRTCDLQGLVNNELWEKNRAIEKMQNVLKGKDFEIGTLEKNMQAKELQLRILKDKINELGVHVNLPPSLFTVESDTHIETPDNLGVVKDQLRVCLEERKHFIKEIEELQNKIKNIPEHDENLELKQLTTEYEDLREELEKTEKLRQENHEICLVLTARLEELCCFLNSLLKQKCVLGFLGTEQTYKLREVVNRSLDLSQTLSSSLLLNPDQSLLQLNNITNLLNSSRNDSSAFLKILAQDEDNNSVLSIIPTDVTLTYRSHLNISVSGNNEPEQIIKILRLQVANLKHEIELRDIELGKKLNDPLSTIVPDDEPAANSNSLTLHRKQKDVNSESESWSEPDRSVSLARIGLLDESLKAPLNTNPMRHSRFASTIAVSTESTEDEHILHGVSNRTPSKRTTLAESRQTVISLHEQVCELEELLKMKENQVLAAQIAAYENENLFKQEQIKLAEMKEDFTDQISELNKRLEDSDNNKKYAVEKIEELEKELVVLTEDIKEANKKLEEAETQRDLHEKKILDLQTLVDTLDDFKRNVSVLDLMNKEMQNTINELEIEKQKSVESAEATKTLLEQANQDVAAAEVALKNMQLCEQHLREELEQNYQNSLKSAEDQYINSVRSIERNYEVQTSKCQDTMVHMKETYQRDYIKRTEVDKRILELDAITKELDSLKYFVKDCENKMHTMEQREIELKGKVQDMQREHHDKIYELHNELDNATLQYSETLLEKTRLQNETTCLEQKVQNFHAKETELIKEVNGLHQEFKDVQNSLHMKISQLEHQKSLLEIKVCDLETANAELQIVATELQNGVAQMKINRNIGERILSKSLPSCPGTILDLYPNKTLSITMAYNSNQMVSDHSGYTSEDIIGDDLTLRRSGMIENRIPTNIDRDHAHGNSSPDLGIESDHGRFSSMECNANISRPLLPTLELTQSMNSLLDPIQDITCLSDQCCMKTKRIADENVELRKRLLRTRRALEDTLNRLTLANKQKKEVEKSICKQIHQTSQVLRKAKANLDSGSESEI